MEDKQTDGLGKKEKIIKAITKLIQVVHTLTYPYSHNTKVTVVVDLVQTSIFTKFFERAVTFKAVNNSHT